VEKRWDPRATRGVTISTEEERAQQIAKVWDDTAEQIPA
jgi:hypothetical protein